jgi:hypothetical protein
MAWLPVDMFDWDSLTFLPDILAKTGWSSTLFREQVKGSQMDRDQKLIAFIERTVADLKSGDPADRRSLRQTLREVCYYRYSRWLLSQLAQADRLPGLSSEAVTKEERLGHCGLSYDLIRRAEGKPPSISFSRAYGGAGGTGTGLSAFRNDWPTRIQLLFDWDDGFYRGNWEEKPFRQWSRLIYRRLEGAGLEREAALFRAGLGSRGEEYIQVLPRYEADKMYQREKAPKNLSEALFVKRAPKQRSWLWQVARPVIQGAKVVEWELMKMEKGGYKTKDDMEEIHAKHPRILAGKRFQRIGDILKSDLEHAPEKEDDTR